MITNNHYIELYINGELIELENQESLNLRINNVLFNPTKTSTTQAEYSFSFDIPSTPNNDRVLGYANNLSRINKFRARYKSQIYADGTPIFDGSLTIQKYNAKDKMYTCNLVNFKVNTLDEIFGETKLTDLHWDVDFDGASTINEINADYNSKYFFPLVSYGVFQKKWKTKDDVAAEYTPKHDIDKYNKWWIESFYPSLNVMETVKRAFEAKGYEAVGSAFLDPYIKDIYASCNLSQEQSPIYNIGNPKFGELKLHVDWNNYNIPACITQDLNFPYNKVSPAINASNAEAEPQYNFSAINVWNMLDKTNNPSGVTTSMEHDSYIYDPDEQIIVIPADGFYRIRLLTTAGLSGAGTSFSANQWTTTFNDGDEFTQRQVNLTKNFLEHTPLEIQLVRNYDENIELIKGRKNIEYATGDPNDETYRYRGGSYTAQTEYINKSEWLTEYPHQDLYTSTSPTKTEGLVITTAQERKGGWSQTTGSTASGTFGGKNNRRPGTDTTSTPQVGKPVNSKGYMHKTGKVMPYDQAVSPAFICGFTTLDGGVVSVMRNGDSWSKMCSITNKIFAKVDGLDLVNSDSTSSTTYCQNEYKNSTNSCVATNNYLVGYVNCCVWLNKNDVLQLMAIQRDYTGDGFGGGSNASIIPYTTSATCQLNITAITDRDYNILKNDQDFGYYSPVEFPTKLNLFNFTNKEMKVSDWLTNIGNAFNLEYKMDGNTVDVDINKGLKKYITNAISIDDRVNSDEAESEFISYPKEMSVRYKIDTDEWGFWTTVPDEYHNAEESVWKEHGDSGYTVIQLNDDSYETSSQNTSTQFSYTWYDNFNYKWVDSAGTESNNSMIITIPVIEKYDYMAEGYNYEESAKHDGYSLTQRFWFRGQPSQEDVWLSSIKANGTKENVYLTYPMNNWNGFNLSYKDTEMSIVSEYFNVFCNLSTNYVNIEVYITPQEYNAIKGGALVNFDSDLYYVSEISGFDPSGGNTTKLKLFKKT